VKASAALRRWNSLLLYFLRGVLALFVLAVLAGIDFPFASGDKSNFIVLIHIGAAVGIVSNWRFIVGLRWTDLINIIGSVLGVAATLVIVFAIKEIKMPMTPDYAAAFKVLGMLLVAKIGLKIIQDRKEKKRNSLS
jgi:hypothetical protein